MWIEARATGALEGNDQWKSIDLPKNGLPARRLFKYEIECLKEINAELLVALREFVKDEGSHSVGCKEYPPGFDDSRCCPVHMARAAIAKATGA